MTLWLLRYTSALARELVVFMILVLTDDNLFEKQKTVCIRTGLRAQHADADDYRVERHAERASAARRPTRRRRRRSTSATRRSGSAASSRRHRRLDDARHAASRRRRWLGAATRRARRRRRGAAAGGLTGRGARRGSHRTRAH